MQVAPPDDQILNQCNLCHLVAKYATNASDAIKFATNARGAIKFVTNASGTIWWPNLQLMQVAPSGGQICN